jgi:uncharacterized protein YbaR (Trm112 family)
MGPTSTRLKTLAKRLFNKGKRTKLPNGIRIKAGDLKEVRAALLLEQDWVCPLCERDLHYIKAQQRCVDHDHSATGPTAGSIREVLCSNCNGNEGRIRNRVLCAKGAMNEIDWLENLLNYWKKHQTSQTGLVHHTHKTQEEKRLLKNKKARAYRRRKKG